jgi:hypothetical protein
MRRALFAAIVLVWVSGCGSSKMQGFPDSGPTGPSLAAVAKELAMWSCTRRFACMPYAAETRVFGDTVADCTTQQTGYQKRSLSAPGVGSDYSGIESCIAELKKASCQDFLDYTIGQNPKAMPACSAFTPGTVANGSGCAYNRQCTSGHCSTVAEGQCGLCAADLAVGATCHLGLDVCDPTMGAICNSLTQTCIVPAARGGVCSSNAGCYENLLCDAMTGTCQDPPSTVGAACDATLADGSGCSFQVGAGVYCNPMTMMCEQPSPNGLGGASCGVNVSSGTVSLCGLGFLCNGSKGGFSGKCIAGHAAPVGSRCTFTGSPVDGPACEAEALCIGDVCTVADPTTCH